jgi:hypothetical protein
MLVVNLVPHGQGWDPINHMVRLAAELLEAELVEMPPTMPSSLDRLLAALSGRRRVRGGERCLLVCASPTDLNRVLDIERWRSRFEMLSAWVIDSFGVELIPRTIRLARPFDHLFVTGAEDVDPWCELTRTPTSCLAWGSDVLRLGSANGRRDLDLLRVGRQPLAWDDDEATARAAAAAGIRFHPRPAGRGLTPLQNQRLLMQKYARTKYVLAFSNIANPTRFTHPRRQYLTGRWVDALASGAVVAGVCPREPSIDRLLWPSATLELADVDRERGLREIVAALPTWHAGIAAANHAWSLRRLDWRWRFEALAQHFGGVPARLCAELAALRLAIEAHPVSADRIERACA